MRRVATGPIVVLTADAEVHGAMWLMAEYLPEVAELDRKIFPPIEQFATWLGGTPTLWYCLCAGTPLIGR